MAMRRSGKSEDDRQELTVHTIMKFLKDRDFPSAKAEKLGVGLGLKGGKLNQFKMENSDLENFLMSVINYWLRSDSAKSWDKLAEALRFCDCNIIADEIQGRRPPINSKRAAEEQFPFIDTKELKDNEILKIRLEHESEKIGREFATLVVLTSASLEKQHYSVQKLILLIKNLPNKNESNNCLIQTLRKLQNISEALEEMSNYWSFFNYELLEAVIRSSNDPELIAKLDKYVERFTHYCKRRLCEVPVDALTAKEVHTKNIVKIKLDNLFNVPLEDVKKTIVKLDSILGTSLHLIGVESGCVQLTFICMHKLDAIFPLSDEQREKISHTKSLKIYSDTEVYYERATELAARSYKQENKLTSQKPEMTEKREAKRRTVGQSTTIGFIAGTGAGARASNFNIGGSYTTQDLERSPQEKVKERPKEKVEREDKKSWWLIISYLVLLLAIICVTTVYTAERDAKMATEKAQREAKMATEKVEREAKMATEKAEREAKMAREAKMVTKKIEREAKMAREKAEREVKMAIEAEREARMAIEKAEREAKMAIEAEREAKMATEKAERETKRAIEAEREAKMATEKAERETKRAIEAEKEAKMATEKAERETKRAIEAEKEAKMATEKAEREAKRAIEKAEREAKMATERAEIEAKMARERAQREAKMAKEEAEREAKMAIEITEKREARRRTVGQSITIGFIAEASTGAIAGGGTGAIIGGIVGSVVPGAGTLIGATTGAVIGTSIGGSIGAAIGLRGAGAVGGDSLATGREDKRSQNK